MRIDVWSDVAFPFCYIGTATLDKAIAELELNDKVEVVHRSYQLGPDLPTEATESTYEYLAKKYGSTPEEMVERNAPIQQKGAELGLKLNTSATQLTNTFDAHRLMHFAADKGKGHDLVLELFEQYFTENNNVADHEVLTAAAVKVGLEPDEVAQVLSSSSYADAVQEDITQAALLGVQGVPFTVIDNKFAVPGAQPLAVFKSAIEKALAGD